MHSVLRRESNSLNRDCLANTGGVDARKVQNNASAERMPNEANREIVDDVEQRRKIKDVLRHVVHRARRPRTVPMPSQVQRVDVVMLAKPPSYPIPVSCMIQSSMDQHQTRLIILTVIPKLQFQSIGIEEM